MPQINVAKREISCKVVYCGPGLSGKTTNIEVVHKKAPKEATGDLTSIATEGDRTLFFDYMPVNLGRIGGLKAKLQLYTVPGQEYYNATRKLVLQGVDGIVFVADSQPDKLDENAASLASLERNLAEQGLDLAHMPLVIQWNKRDLPDALPVEELEAKLNRYGAPTVEAVAVSGEGVLLTLKKITKLTLERASRGLGQPAPRPEPEPASEPAPRPSTSPVRAPTPRPAPIAPVPVNRPSSTRRRAPARPPEPERPANAHRFEPTPGPAPSPPRPARRLAYAALAGGLAVAALAGAWALDVGGIRAVVLSWLGRP